MPEEERSTYYVHENAIHIQPIRRQIHEPTTHHRMIDTRDVPTSYCHINTTRHPSGSYIQEHSPTHSRRLPEEISRAHPLRTCGEFYTNPARMVRDLINRIANGNNIPFASDHIAGRFKAIGQPLEKKKNITFAFPPTLP